MDKIKAKLEQLYHRLQGHLLVTYNDGTEEKTIYALDIYTTSIMDDDGNIRDYINIDFCDGGSIEIPAYTDITITGA